MLAQPTNRQNSIPKNYFNQRTVSTYSDTFGDSPVRRLKGKELNLKHDFKLEEVASNLKFPPIPKTKIGEEHIKKNFIREKLNRMNYITKQETANKNTLLSKTIDNGSLSKVHKISPKAKNNQNHSILASINNPESLGGIFSQKNKHYNIAPILKTNLDRPKLSLLQDTLHGILQTNSEFKKQQRKLQKFKNWGGIKIPINSQLSFNHCKDPLNRWDEHRDGVFHQL
jgi:hypothetical protein